MPSPPTPELLNEHARSILDRHLKPGVAEEEIRVAVRDFLVASGLARAGEIEMEQAPAAGSTGRVDLRTRDLIIEFKVRIGDRITPREEHVRQLDDYLDAAIAGGRPQRFGILTDGRYWILRWPGMGPVRTHAPHAFTLTDAQHGLALYEWLRDQSQALEERHILPTEDEIRSRLGEGPRFERHIEALARLYEANRDDPTIALKRDLWRTLLAAALGQVVEDEPDLDRLFIRHTYLSVVVGLAVQAAFGIEIEAASPSALLNGERFVAETGVSGVVESDFFTWPAESGPAEAGGEAWIRDLAKRIGWFDWSQAEWDIARILYESVIPADDRRRLGEYYTPDWLAREIVDAVVTDPLNQRVLDPACGSGSFIFAAVRRYLGAAREAGRSWSQCLDGLLSRVIGIDVHPVAVHLARATWTLAAREALEGAVSEGGSARDAATVPIYLGDSLQLRTETSGMFAQQIVSIPIPDAPGAEVKQNRVLEFPRERVEQADWFDSLMTRMASTIEQGGDPVWALDAAGGAEHRRMLEHTARLLKQLHDEGRDHIWAYYTRNLVRPVALRANPVDVIVGNPPWIPYRATQAVVRDELRTQSKDLYGIWPDQQYVTHLDVAGMFYARCVDLYLKQGGTAGMVCPHSALQAGQYTKWRGGEWGALSVDLGWRRPWDLEKIEPNTFFPMPASVVFLRRIESSGRPLGRRADRWRGPAGGPFTIEQVPLTDTSGEFASPYGGRARQGATIVPRGLFFVNTEKSTALVQAANTLIVSPRRNSQEKKPWKDLALSELASQAIEAEHVFDVYLGETVAPYVLFDPLRAVLPLSKRSGRLEKQEDGWYGIDPLSLGDRMRWRWRTMNELWDANKSRNTKESLIQWLDYMGKLSAQRPSDGQELPRIRVAHTTSGRPTAAIVDDPDAIIDTKLYWAAVKSMAEAQFLVAIINSQALTDAVAPLMGKGQFGPRDVHKHLWRLPIPEYDESNPLHVELAEAGAAAAAGAQQAWREARAELEAKKRSTAVAAARREILAWLAASDEGQRVESLVGRLLEG